MMHSDPCVQIEDVCKVYASGRLQVTALDHVNLAVAKGCFLGITGRSGKDPQQVNVRVDPVMALRHD